MLELMLTPQIGPAVVRIEPPAYTGQAAREIPYRFTALQVLEGSELHFHVKSNRPLGIGACSLNAEGKPPPRFRCTAPEGPPMPRRGFHRHEVRAADLQPGRCGRQRGCETPTASLTITRDLAPAIAITVPEQDAMIVEGLELPIIVDATDDYGLRSVRLHVGLNDKFQEVEPVTFDEPDTRRHRMNTRWTSRNSVPARRPDRPLRRGGGHPARSRSSRAPPPAA